MLLKIILLPGEIPNFDGFDSPSSIYVVQYTGARGTDLSPPFF
jgi:hypothetical protein